MFPTALRLLEAVSLPFKRAQLGLFQGKTKQYGNNVPFSKKKTRRSWLPNVHNKRLFSDALQRNIQLKVTARALRTIKKHGSLDQYVLKTNPELLGYEGMRIRMAVQEAQALKTSEVATQGTPQPVS
ncbi:ribosomal L28 family-domain-containing protein [Irpex lacteus]|nr:ribosomal L28 family-domain-containing protein [Irpex lacteus]